ncbi:MAG: hypothetical protein ACPGLV_14580, partial [Bacteroidia bacterium]
MAVLWRKLVLFTLFLLQLGYVKADHLFGGQIEWEMINSDTIKLTGISYSECNAASQGRFNFQIIGDSYFKYTRAGVSTVYKQDVTPLCAAKCGSCNSNCSINYGVVKNYGSVLFSIKPYKQQGVKWLKVWYSDSERSATTTNVKKEEGMTCLAMINIAGGIVNSPKSTADPNIIKCLNKDVIHNLSSTIDSDHDLFYYLSDPYSFDTSKKVTWNSNFNYNRPVTFNGFPNANASLPQGFHLDSSTGILRFRPRRLEESFASIKTVVMERGKTKAWKTTDFLILILKCANNDAPVISGTNCRTPSSQNFDFIACGGQSNCFSLCIDDADQNDSISLKRVGDTTFGSFNIYSSGNAIDSAKFCYSPTVADTGKEFQLMLNVNDNVCPIPSSSNYVYRIKVVPFYNVNLSLSVSKIDSCGNYELKAKEAKNQDIQDLRWYLNDTLEIGQGIESKYAFTQNGSYKITAFHNGCSTQSFDTTITVTGVKPISITEYPDTLLCASQELELEMNAKGGHGNLDLQWNIPNTMNVLSADKKSNNIKLGFNKQSGEQNLALSYGVTDSFGCKAEHRVNARVKDFELRALEADQSYCLNGDTVLPLALFNNQTGWTGQGVRNDTFFSNLAPRQTIILQYINKENNTCIVDSAIIGNYEPPTLNLGQSFTICKEANDTLLNATPTNGTWTGSAIDNQGNFSPSLANAGTSYLSYFGTDSNGCSNTDSLLITVVDYKPSITITDTVQTCLNGENLELTAQPKGGQWSAQGFGSNNNEISLEPRLFGTGTYEVIYSYKDSNQCSNADTAIAIINELPKPAFEVDSVVFQKDTLELSNQTTEINTTNYTWIITGPQNITETGFEPQIIMDSLGMHGITLIATDGKTGCTDTLASNDSVKVVLNT